MSTEERINQKFLVGLRKTPLQTFETLQLVYRDNTMSYTFGFDWHRRFKYERKRVKDVSKSGWPSTSRTDVNMERVRQVVLNDRCLTVRMIASPLDMEKSGSVWKIITEDLGMSESYETWFAEHLTVPG